MQNFTPLAGLAGGLLIGLAAAVLLLALGRIAGISGLVAGLLAGDVGRGGWRAAFVVGLPLGAVTVAWTTPGSAAVPSMSGGWLLVTAAGFLVGFGARLGGGCTSGHGVCGIPRFSVRSVTATATFMGVAMLTVLVTRHLL